MTKQTLYRRRKWNAQVYRKILQIRGEKDFSHLTDLTYCWQPIFFVVSLRADAVGKVCSCKGTAVTKTNIFHLSFCKILPYSRRRGLFLTFTTHDIRP